MGTQLLHDGVFGGGERWERTVTDSRTRRNDWANKSLKVFAKAFLGFLWVRNVQSPSFTNVLVWVNQGRNPLGPRVNPCCTTKPQLVAFGALGLSPFVRSCRNATGFAFSSQSFAPE